MEKVKTFKISTINEAGEKSGEKAVPAEIFGVKASPVLIARAVQRFLANQRKARAKTKTRSEVKGSGAKIWRQKGTGHARHGDRKAPIFVGGGVAHGPTGRQNYQKKMNRILVKKSILAILAERLESHRVFLWDEVKFEKTKDAAVFLQNLKKNLKIEGKISFLLTPDSEAKRYLRNLKNVFLLGVKSLNPVSLLKADYLFLTGAALKELEKIYSTEKKEK